MDEAQFNSPMLELIRDIFWHDQKYLSIQSQKNHLRNKKAISVGLIESYQAQRETTTTKR